MFGELKSTWLSEPEIKVESLKKAAGVVLGIGKGGTLQKGESWRPEVPGLLATGWGGGLLSKDSIVMELLSKRSSRLNGKGKSS